jgi:hypothetical protein
MSVSHLALYNDLLADLDDFVPGLNFSSEGEAKVTDFHPGSTYRQAAALALAKSFFKKCEDRSSADCEQVALDAFLSSNSRCLNWELRINDMEGELLYGLFEQQVNSLFEPNGNIMVHSFYDVFDGMDVGPGASVGAHGSDFYTKLFSSPLTTTDVSLATLYGAFIDRYPNWRHAEELRHAEFGSYVKVEGSRLSFVPKNDVTARTICTEPSLNMLVQRGVSSLIEKRLRRVFGINLETQPFINRALAQTGSKTGRLATIDLSQASDSIALSMVRTVVPAAFSGWLEVCRSPKTILPNGQAQELYMLSSMGNGYTFSLQTALFCCAVAAVYEASEMPLRRSFTSSQGETRLGNFGVFGDDIIVEAVLYRKIVKLLNILGFQVNSSKSFCEGPFRESCGGDYFDGSPVRGVYIKSLKRPQNRYVAINRLNQWTAMTGIPLCRTVKRLVKSVRYLPVPLYENDDAGIKVPFSMVEIPRHDDNFSVKYRRWSSSQKLMRLADGALIVPKGARPRIYNPSGLLLAGLRGNIRSDAIGIRLGPAKYRTKEAITPNWDWLPPATDDIRRWSGPGGEPGLHLRDAITLNLG